MQSGQGYESVVGSCERGIELSDIFKCGKYFISSIAVNSQMKTDVHRYSPSVGQSVI